MSAIPKHYRLVKEHPKSYELHDLRDNKSFHIAKQGLSLPMHTTLNKIQKFDEGSTDVEPVTEEVQATPSDASPAEPIAAEVPAGQTEAVADALDTGESSSREPASMFVKGSSSPFDFTPKSTPPEPTEPNQQSKLQGAPALPKDPYDQYLGDVNKAMGAERGAMAKGAQAEGWGNYQAGREQIKAANLANNLPTQAEIYKKYQTAQDNLQQMLLAKEVDPDRFFNKKDTMDRITTGLGLVLGGMGAGMTGQPNYAYAAMEKAIDRDIDSQKNDQTNVMNLWKMNRDALGNDQEANLATKNQYYEVAKAKALGFLAQAQGPIAKARIAPAISLLDQAIAKNNLLRAQMQPSQENPYAKGWNDVGRPYMGPAGTAGSGMSNTNPAFLMNVVPQHAQEGVAKEMENAMDVHALQEGVENSATHLEGLMGKGIFSPNDRASAINTWAGRIGKMAEGTYSHAQVESLIPAMFPEKTDTAQTLANKRQRRQEFFASLAHSPRFTQHTGGNLNHYAATTTNDPRRFSQAPNPGQVMQGNYSDEVRALQIQYAQQNATSKDPTTQKRVQFIKKKYGMK